MTRVEVTKADRDAAEAFAEVLCLAAAKNGTLLHFTQNDDGILVQAFARHRDDVERLIIAWLREQGGKYGRGIGESVLQVTADAIERGDHRKESLCS